MYEQLPPQLLFHNLVTNECFCVFRDNFIHTLIVSVSGISVKIRSRLLSSLTDRLLKSWLALLMMGMAASGKNAALDWAAQIR